MKISLYSTAFNAIEKNFDFKDALNNWFYYVDEVVLAVNTSNDNTYNEIEQYGESKKYNLKLINTQYSYDDPFCYGKIVNAALQGCSNSICILNDLDERIGGDRYKLIEVCKYLDNQEQIKSLFVPVINLWGGLETYSDFGAKWYIHKTGLFRGAVDFGVKQNGRPDYSKTSTDELIDENHKLVPTLNLSEFLGIKELDYCKSGYPFIWHLGYENYNDRLSRNKFWKPFWEKATGGDENCHATSIKELEQKKTFKHNLLLWNIKK